MLGWIIVCIIIILILICIFFFFFDSIYQFCDKKTFKKKIYKTLHYYAEEEDHLLLNDVNVFLDDDDDKPTVFDHILLADKYIYVISSFFEIGGLYGNSCDPYLFLKNKNSKKGIKKIDNPIIINEINVKKLEKLLNVPSSDKMFVSIVLYNNSIIVPKELEKIDQISWFLPLKELKKSIKSAEKDDVSVISHDKTESMLKLLKSNSDKLKKELQNKEE